LSHIYCPECGFQNLESAHYCSRCGALLVVESEPDETTITISAEEVQDEHSDLLEELGVEGPALVVRSGGGRTGEVFTLEKPQTTVGRSPDCDIFLDDVTVSRDHALLIRRADGYHLDDCGSLNGTYVNRRRVESVRLEDGDELQIGKYKLSFLTR